MAAAWKQQSARQRSPGVLSVCVFTWTAVYSLFILIYFWFKRMNKRGELMLKIISHCYTLLRASTCDCKMWLFLWHPETPLSLSCETAKQKHCTQPPLFCLFCHTHSFYVPYPLFFATLSILPSVHVCLLPPTLSSSCHFSLLANSQLSLPLSALLVIAD